MNLLDDLFENAPCGLHSLGPDGTILRINQTALTWLGYERAEVEGKVRLPELLTPESQEVFEANFPRFKESGFVRDVEVTLIRKDGQPLPILVSAVAVRDPAGNYVSSRSIAYDVTELKKVEAAQVRLMDRYRNLLQTATDGIHVLNQNGDLVEASPSFYRLLGYEVGDARLKNVADWDVRWSADELIGKIKEMATGSKQFETRHRRRDGTLIEVEVTARGIDLDGSTHLYASARDITERKGVEEHLRRVHKLDGIAHLAGGLAHEFNNILAAQSLSLSLLKSMVTEPHALELLGELDGLSLRAAKLVKQVLACARQSQLEPHPLNLATFLEEQRNLVAHVLGGQVTPIFSAGDVPAWVSADAHALNQVLLSLSLNARDAMPDGGVFRSTIAVVEATPGTVGAPAHPVGGRYVRWSVADTGCGMAPRTQEHLFEPFFTTKQIGAGAGMGLATALGVVEQHQGWIDFESTLGKGTTFHIFLPAIEAPGPRPAPPTAVAQANGATVLVVEDEAIVRKLVQRVLAWQGYRVLEARTGDEALEVWARHRAEIRLLYTDVVMPGALNGFQLAEQLLAQAPQLKVIITSGYNAEAHGQISLPPESYRYLPKPCDLPTLVATIQGCLHG
jgi:PAS domain S-box-containing protein